MYILQLKSLGLQVPKGLISQIKTYSHLHRIYKFQVKKRLINNQNLVMPNDSSSALGCNKSSLLTPNIKAKTL
jgi:hypothetical protein